MAITITIDDPRQLAGIEAAAAAYNAKLDPEAEDYAPLTAEQYANDRLLAVCDSWADHHNVGRVTASAFVLRFTPTEIETIKTASGTDANVAAFLDRVSSVDWVRLYAEEVAQGVAYCVSQGLFTQSRADEILSY